MWLILTKINVQLVIDGDLNPNVVTDQGDIAINFNNVSNFFRHYYVDGTVVQTNGDYVCVKESYDEILKMVLGHD